MPAYVFGIIYLAYTFYGIKKENDGIGHSAHLGGAVGGISLSIILAPQLIFLSFETLLLLRIVIILGAVYFRKSLTNFN